MLIKYYQKNVYDKEMLYVFAPEKALNLELINGKKTISIIDIALFKTLGVEFEQVLPPNPQKS